MMHAKILEIPDERPTQSDGDLAGCLKQLSAADRNYYRRRAIQEDEAAARAPCSEARLAHKDLAAAYWQLCRSKSDSANPHFASELAMFRFNSLPTD